METVNFYDEIVQEKDKNIALNKLKEWWTKSHCTLTSIDDEKEPGGFKTVFVDPTHFLIDFKIVPEYEGIEALISLRIEDRWKKVSKEKLNTPPAILRQQEQERILQTIYNISRIPYE